MAGPAVRCSSARPTSSSSTGPPRPGWTRTHPSYSTPSRCCRRRPDARFLGALLSLRLELQVLVRRRPRVVRDEAEPRFRHARTDPLQEGELPDRKDHGLVVDQLLDAMEERLALLRVELTRLLLEEPVDVGVSPVGVGATRDGERLDPGGRVAEDTAQPVDNVLQLLFPIRLEKPRPLERAKPRLDTDGLKIVEDRLGVHAGPGIAPEVPGIEALRVPGLREELPGLARIVGVERRLPVELEAGRDDAPGYLG